MGLCVVRLRLDHHSLLIHEADIPAILWWILVLVEMMEHIDRRNIVDAVGLGPSNGCNVSFMRGLYNDGGV